MNPVKRVPFQQSRLKQLQQGQQYSHQKLQKALQNPQINRSLGCVFGSWIGDTLGSYCEFSPTIVSQQRLFQAMQMNGGGPFFILPGQFTDDSQMSVALLQGLISYKESKTIKQQKLHLLTQISKEYVSWLDSQPFDIGQTCFNAICHLKSQSGSSFDKKDFDQIRIEKIMRQIFQINRQKESNGSLMRIAPMTVFYSMLENEKQEITDLIKSEIQLTHPNQKLVQLGIDWVRLNSKIINRHQTQLTLKEIYEDFIFQQKQRENNIIQDYIEQGLKDELMDGVSQMGWAKIAFSYSINQFRELTKMDEKVLQKNSSQIYKNMIRKVMKQGGDTDTNCAIVGSIVGSIVGFKGLPQEYVQKIINLNLSYNKNSSSGNSWNRPQKYEPRSAFLSMLKLIGKLNPRYKII